MKQLVTMMSLKRANPPPVRVEASNEVIKSSTILSIMIWAIIGVERLIIQTTWIYEDKINITFVLITVTLIVVSSIYW